MLHSELLVTGVASSLSSILFCTSLLSQNKKGREKGGERAPFEEVKGTFQAGWGNTSADSSLAYMAPEVTGELPQGKRATGTSHPLSLSAVGLFRGLFLFS